MENSSNKSYSNGKIYIIRNYVDNDTYIGSSCQALCKRMENHRSDKNRKNKKHFKIYEKMNELGFDNFYIELVEEYPCENVEQLRRREGELIRQFKPTLNKEIAGRTINEWREDNKGYTKNYYQNNKQKLLEQVKQYNEKNKDIISERKKKHYQANKERFAEERKETMTCECGMSFTKQHRARHIKSQHHQKFLNNNINNVSQQEEETTAETTTSTTIN